MKRFLTIGLCIFMALAFTACGGGKEQNSSDSSQTSMYSNGEGATASGDEEEQNSSDSSQMPMHSNSGGDVELPEDKFN